MTETYSGREDDDVSGIVGVGLLDRMGAAVAAVREMLLRATDALKRASIPDAVIGGNAVTSWIAQVDEGAVRNTPDVDLLLRREDFAVAAAALNAASLAIFPQSDRAKPRSAVHVTFAREHVRPQEVLPNPDVTDAVTLNGLRVLTLAALVQTKLTAYRTVDKVHLRDMLNVGLIDGTWRKRYPQELAERLQWLIDTPEG